MLSEQEQAKRIFDYGKDYFKKEFSGKSMKEIDQETISENEFTKKFFERAESAQKKRP